jgi:hypothetical protein
VSVEVLRLDPASLQSIREFAAILAARHELMRLAADAVGLTPSR